MNWPAGGDSVIWTSPTSKLLMRARREIAGTRAQVGHRSVVGAMERSQIARSSCTGLSDGRWISGGAGGFEFPRAHANEVLTPRMSSVFGYGSLIWKVSRAADL